LSILDVMFIDVNQAIMIVFPPESAISYSANGSPVA